MIACLVASWASTQSAQAITFTGCSQNTSWNALCSPNTGSSYERHTYHGMYGYWGGTPHTCNRLVLAYAYVAYTNSIASSPKYTKNGLCGASTVYYNNTELLRVYVLNGENDTAYHTIEGYYG